MMYDVYIDFLNQNLAHSFEDRIEGDSLYSEAQNLTMLFYVERKLLSLISDEETTVQCQT